MLKISKNGYLKGFCLAVIALGVIRAVFPNVAMTADVGRRFARKGMWGGIRCKASEQSSLIT